MGKLLKQSMSPLTAPPPPPEKKKKVGNHCSARLSIVLTAATRGRPWYTSGFYQINAINSIPPTGDHRAKSRRLANGWRQKRAGHADEQVVSSQESPLLNIYIYCTAQESHPICIYYKYYYYICCCYNYSILTGTRPQGSRANPQLGSTLVFTRLTSRATISPRPKASVAPLPAARWHGPLMPPRNGLNSCDSNPFRKQ